MQSPRLRRALAAAAAAIPTLLAAGPAAACPDCAAAIAAAEDAAIPFAPGAIGSGLQPGGPGGPPPGMIGDPAAEAEFLADHVQLTFGEDWVRAGESYFDRTGRWIIFQAVPQPAPGTEPDPHYSMYVAKVKHDGYGHIAGLHEAILVSEPGSANTCGWFHPTQPGVILFGSTVVPPADEQRAGYSRDRSRYTWQFPAETEVCTRTVRAIVEDMVSDPAERERLLARPDVDAAVPMFRRPGYDAEGSWSPDGRSVLYCNVNPDTGDGDIYAYIVATGEHRPITIAGGYDGGPFFSPDGRWITYRSDRRGDNLLQLFVAELAFDADGLPRGVKREIQLTDAGHVNWAPYWNRPDGRYLVYASSEVAHYNYEVYAIAFDRETGTPSETRRITNATGFDGLPVFSFDGRWMMWTGQRGDDRNAEGRPSSQLWAARLVKSPF